MNRLNKHSRPSEKTFWVCITNWSAVVSYCIEQGNEFKCFGFLHHNSFHWILVIQIQENSSHTCIPNQLSVQNLNNLFMVLLLSVFTMGSGAHCSMLIGVRPVTQRSLVPTPLWSIDIVYYTHRQGMLSTLYKTTQLEWVRPSLVVLCDGLVPLWP